MDEKAISAINKNKDKYFDEDRAGIYNSLKTDIREKLNSKDFDKEILDKKNNEFQNLKDQKDSADSDYQLALENVKQSATSDLAEKMKNRELKDLQRKELQKEIDEINNDNEENINKTKNIKALNKQIKKQDEIIDQIQGNITLRSDVDKMKAICKNIKIDVKKIVKQKIIEDCNYELKKFLLEINCFKLKI